MVRLSGQLERKKKRGAKTTEAKKSSRKLTKTTKATRAAVPEKKRKKKKKARTVTHEDVGSAFPVSERADMQHALPRARLIGRYERLAYERQEKDLRLAYGERWDDPTVYGDPSLTQHPKGFWYDADEGERVVQFKEKFCNHHKGEWAGKPLILEDWQKFCTRVTYGWFRQDGTRRFRISYREVPRKNGKSEEAAAEANYLTIADREPGAEVYSTATKEDQAKIVWTSAREQIKQSPFLRKYMRLRQTRIECERLTSFFRPLGADSDTLDGLNPHGHVCDELHAHKKRGLWDVMITGMGARRQPMTVVITTAGVYDPESIGWELHTLAQQVLDGVVEDDTFFCIIFALDEEDVKEGRWKEPEFWGKANPNLGVSVKPDYLAEQVQRAINRPSSLNSLLRLHMNVWTQQVMRWISLDAWNACNGNALTLEGMRGRQCFAAVDLSTKLDITALALCFPFNDAYQFLWKFYVPHARVLQQTQDGKKPDYAAWVRDGWLTETPGTVIDYDFIRRDLLKIMDTVRIVQLAYDPWNATQFSTNLEADGFTKDPDEKQKPLLVEMRQNIGTLSEPSKKFEELVVSSRVYHGANPVMRWMVDNTAIRTDANENIAPDKRNASGRIDGVVASIMSLGRAIVTPVQQVSVYESRGVRTL